ncbi:hypothetical protein MTR62_02675 [Novosphingobium sp. 1949]|uniref:Uncharacterized protein n=1 Tax=Novosphingobium organovorum TaxID=2930092 RepID=A0ABT0B9Z1_9SPHN|nr:hypothetical protein [Novosphingobium organovorum]MCJ2181619.1 hypothetical protein [Novosphingobium organovorum]
MTEPTRVGDEPLGRDDALLRDRAVVRALRDMALCAGGTVLGARLDGPLAFLAMQSICSGDGFDPIGAIAVHARVLPMTSAIMAVIALLCQWPGPMPRATALAMTGRDRALRWVAFGVRAMMLFVAMMLVMSVMQAPFRLLAPASASGAVLASVTGMLLLAVVTAVVRPLALRVPFLIPFCCR